MRVVARGLLEDMLGRVLLEGGLELLAAERPGVVLEDQVGADPAVDVKYQAVAVRADGSPGCRRRT